MTPELFTGLVLFAFVSSITPGPNNLMLMASGANFGFRRSVPHMLGVAIGFVVMVLAMGAGVAGLFQAFPVARDILRVVSVVYLLWLAWKIANAGAPDGARAKSRPMTFLQVAAFQWVNPKAWAMALTGVTAYTPAGGFGMVLLVGLVFGLVNLPSVGSWTVAGQQMARLLAQPRRLVMFNRAMALLLVLSLYPVVA
ncbi:LysE family translocator [Arenibacterium halophilum]|uniref:LysE family translocator n=1 Tax=Arenibacterium halophilum TaxID=2583821 RepID=A0ABY2X7J1_9RHOB|nr:LysE family translocator [Arenibacterium halophilum]TMV11751.1 LysE family translocator [Arenibacterium halophilum]